MRPPETTYPRPRGRQPGWASDWDEITGGWRKKQKANPRVVVVGGTGEEVPEQAAQPPQDAEAVEAYTDTETETGESYPHANTSAAAPANVEQEQATLRDVGNTSAAAPANVEQLQDILDGCRTHLESCGLLVAKMAKTIEEETAGLNVEEEEAKKERDEANKEAKAKHDEKTANIKKDYAILQRFAPGDIANSGLRLLVVKAIREGAVRLKDEEEEAKKELDEANDEAKAKHDEKLAIIHTIQIYEGVARTLKRELERFQK